MRPEFWKRLRPDGSEGKKYWTNLFGVRVSTDQSNERDARTWKAARLREGADPRLAAAEKARLDDAIREVYAELRRRGRAAATLKRAKDKLGHFARLWGSECKLASIDARKVGAYIDVRLTEPGIREGATVQRITIRDELAFLRQMLKIARRQGLYHLAIDDVLPLIFETGHVPKKDFIPFKDLGRVLCHVPGHRKSHVIYFCVCGGRYADSTRARREDFDTKQWRITVRGSKTKGSARTIPVPAFLRPLVHDLLDWAPDKNGLLFLPWDKVDRDLKASCVRAKVPKVSTNGLRRTFGHALRVHGFDLDTISKLFGHTTAKLAKDVYADVDGDELAAVVEKAEERGKQETAAKRTRNKGRTKKVRAPAKQPTKRGKIDE